MAAAVVAVIVIAVAVIVAGVTVVAAIALVDADFHILLVTILARSFFFTKTLILAVQVSIILLVANICN